MDDFTADIVADGGSWSETEILGNHAIVKVNAAPATLATINAEPGFIRLPKDSLNSTLGDLTTPQKNAIKNKLNALGYSNQEIADALPDNWQAVTLRQVLRFAATRRLKARYDANTDTIHLDGDVQPVKDVDTVDGEIS
jgi:hypothetical protein